MILDRSKKPYSKAELDHIDIKPASAFAPEIPVYNTPISYRENTNNMFWEKKLAFAAMGTDTVSANSSIYNEKLGRTIRINGVPSGLVDVFGVEWTYVPEAKGSITLGGNPIFEDANDWKEFIKIPDIDEWDWATDAQQNKTLDTRFSIGMTLVNGFGFERLISHMDFMNAAMALVDEDQWDALHEYLEAMTELGCKIIDKICEYNPLLDGIILHDDWGSQKDPFFSQEVAEGLFLPHLKKLGDHIHNKGRYFGLHSCGHVEDRIGVFIKAGVDTWQMQRMNNPHKLYEEYGDKIVLQVWPEEFDVNDEKAAVQAARNFIDEYGKPGKPVIMSSRDAVQSRVFVEELYEYSRKHFLNN